ncbi:MAG: hypothetical protein KC636_13395, partial [Myxococcales bacterium]|nr:hypothetical protein [Myxococcales bacterium]
MVSRAVWLATLMTLGACTSGGGETQATTESDATDDATGDATSDGATTEETTAGSGSDATT